MTRSKVLLAVSMLLVVGVFGCKAKQEAATPAPEVLPAAQMAATADSSLSGKVAETMNSGGYTYVLIEKSGKKTWVAVPQTTVKVGQEVVCQPGMEMKNFTSKTLNRTFESIYFSTGLI